MGLCTKITQIRHIPLKFMCITYSQRYIHLKTSIKTKVTGLNLISIRIIVVNNE